MIFWVARVDAFTAGSYRLQVTAFGLNSWLCLAEAIDKLFFSKVPVLLSYISDALLALSE